jgi:hypothetical protein
MKVTAVARSDETSCKQPSFALRPQDDLRLFGRRYRLREGLLRDAAFAEVRIEEVHGRFLIPDVDEYLSVIADTAGPIALALQGLEEADLAAVRAEVKDSLGRFTADGGYELPCVAVCAVAS